MTSEDGGIGNWHQLTPWCRAVGCNAGSAQNGKRWRGRRASRSGNACPASGTVTGRASFAGGNVAAWWCAAIVLCGGVARQTGQETQFCSQLVLASIMIGRLCKVLWPCAVRRREATEGERGRRGSLRGRPLRNAINSCSRRQGELGVSGRTLFSLSRLCFSLAR